jgi:hypothetical protein
MCVGRGAAFAAVVVWVLCVLTREVVRSVCVGGGGAWLTVLEGHLKLLEAQLCVEIDDAPVCDVI